jgi:thiol:disulfide interchange protein
MMEAIASAPRTTPMPPSNSRKKPAANPKLLWAGLAMIVVAAVLAYFFWSKPAPAPVEPVATAPVAPPAIMTRHIYSETADPKADIAAALVQAKREHKRVLIDFGGDWCGDCQVLDIYFRQPPNAELLANNFVLVHVWIGHIDTNLDIPAKYGLPINRGVPALAVLSPDGKVVYAQQTGEFNDMRHMESASVTEFLNKWKS